MNERLNNFEKAFSTHSGGCRRTCECGRQFYNYLDVGCWEEGELESLQKNPEAIGVDHTVGTLMIDGREYVDACECWHEQGKALMAWMERHGQQIAEFLSLEKERKIKAAQNSPVVREAKVKVRCSHLGQNDQQCMLVEGHQQPHYYGARLVADRPPVEIPPGWRWVTKGTTNAGDKVWNIDREEFVPVDAVNEYVSHYLCVIRPT